MENWIENGVEKDLNYDLEMVYRVDDNGKEVLVAAGYEFEREQSGVVDGTEIEWTERVLVIKSEAIAELQIKGLEKRLNTAIEQIKALTPERGRGKRQITDEQQLNKAIEKVLKKQRIKAQWLEIDYDQQIDEQTQFVGKGRGSENRATKVIKKVRFSINSVSRNFELIDETKELFGWKAFVTSQSVEKLSLSEAVINYRHEYRVERIFNRLKSHLNIAPGFVKRNDQIKGLTNLLSLGVRVLTVIEYVVRRSLTRDNAKLPDLHPENRQTETNKPTAKRLLSAFSNISLTILKTSIGEVFRYLTPLSELHKEILKRLELDISLYLYLEIIKS
ncbi:transposase [Beggiatoa sp. PS]|nr:transposase [Beggiatoa sp. PS]